MNESSVRAEGKREKRSDSADNLIFHRSAIVFGIVVIVLGIMGLIGLAFDLTVFRSFFPGYQTMAFSTAVLCIFFGMLLISCARQLLHRKVRIVFQFIVAIIAVVEAIELPLNLEGEHFAIEALMVQAGNAIAGQPTSPISPGSLFLVILLAIGFFLLLSKPKSSQEEYFVRDTICIIGLTATFVGFTFLMSYAYGIPFLYGTPFIPIAAPTALALTCIGLGLTFVAGARAFPLRYFVGTSTVARLLRTFLPLIIAVIIFESFLDLVPSFFSKTSAALQFSITIVAFSLVTGYLVIRAARGLGGALEVEELKRKTVEEALLKEHFLLEEAMDQGKMAYWELDVPGRMFTFNDRFYALYGTTAEREGGYQMSAEVYATKFVFPEESDMVAREIEKSLSTTDPHYFSELEHRIIRGDGEVRHIIVRYRLAKDAEGRTIKTHGVNQDITDRKHAENALRESEEKYRLVSEYNYDWEFWTDPAGRMVYNSPSCERITGYSSTEFQQDPVLMSKIIHSEDRSDYDTHIAAIMAGNVDIKQLDFRIIRKDGEIRWINHYCQAVYAQNGTPLGRRGSNRDITDRKQAENALAIANKKLNILNSITRHDILNQLTAIQGFLELYHEECQGDAKLEKYFSSLLDIAGVIETQLEFTKFYQDLGVQAPLWLPAQEVAGKIARNKIFGEIRFIIDDAPLEIYADPLLEKVFFNLYENSLRHGEHVTEVRVSYRISGNECIIVVEDNGIGVPYPDKERIFERGVGKHTGLGLFLAREILAITGITIRETGEPGKGARFEIVAPKGVYR